MDSSSAFTGDDVDACLDRIGYSSPTAPTAPFFARVPHSDWRYSDAERRAAEHRLEESHRDGLIAGIEEMLQNLRTDMCQQQAEVEVLKEERARLAGEEERWRRATGVARSPSGSRPSTAPSQSHTSSVSSLWSPRMHQSSNFKTTSAHPLVATRTSVASNPGSPSQQYRSRQDASGPIGAGANRSMRKVPLDLMAASFRKLEQR